MRADGVIHAASRSERMRQLYRRAIRELTEEHERQKPTEGDLVRQALGSIPECPRVRAALANVPAEVAQQWKADFVRKFLECQEKNPIQGIDQLGKQAHLAASKIFRVERPETIEQARAIPDWQLLRRQELDFGDLPAHAQDDVCASEGARASGRYLEVLTIDGGQYFFEVSNQPATTAA